ncbi:MAG TPA: magnesium/cobalt transporter CorA [Dehalococcoidia bacterium]|jgi:magnesium transporter|nr:magnesium/cobalt transporter CorA [Dehalococcoidia bacterium]
MAIREVAAKKEQLNLESVTWNDLTWINIERPTERETEYLAQHFPFHPLDLDDCLSRVQRPKIDEYKDYLFLVLHFPVFNKETRATTPSQVSVFIGDDYLITLHKGELKPLVKLFKECQLEEDAREEYFSQGSGYLLYRIIDRLVDYCLPMLNRISDNIEQTEDNVFASKGIPRTIEDISILRRDVISFRRIIWPMRAVIASLEPKIRRFTKMDLSVYFGDTVDHVDKIWDALDEYKEIIEGLNDTHDSLATNRTNEVMRMLTIIATILLPLTVVASIYGMNIPLPFQESHYSFVVVFFTWVIVAGGMLYFFRRHRWI